MAGESKSTTPPPALRRWWIAAPLVVLVLAAYWPVLTNGFIEMFDDGWYITQNGWVRQGLTWESIRWALAVHRDGGTYWHPLAWLSFMGDVELFGVRPGPIHAVNLAWHSVTAALLFLALHRMTARFWRSAAVALLFAVHPLQVESVAWAVERKTVLASALGMGGVLAYAWYAGRPSAGRYLATFALFGLSVLAKPLLVTFPFLLLLLDVWPLGRTALAAPEVPGGGTRIAPWPRLLLEKVPFLAVALPVVAQLRWSSRAIAEEFPLLQRASNALTSYWKYLGKIAWPSDLAVYYPNPSDVSPWTAAAAAAGLALVSALLVAARRRVSPGAVAGWCWFLGTTIPVSGIVRSGLWPAMADRFMYVPMIGILVAVVWGAASLVRGGPRRTIVLGGAVAVALVASSVRSHAQALLWRDPLTLFGHAVEVTPPSRFVWANYGKALEYAGRLEEARAWWERMIRVMPDAADGYVNLGVMWHEAGDLDRAEAAYRAALEKEPGCAQAHYDLALVEKRRGYLELALAGLRRARAAGLRNAPVLEKIGEVSAELGRDGDAEAAYGEAFRADPLSWRAGVALARLQAARGRTGEAAAVLREAWGRAGRVGEADVARQLGVEP